MIDAPPPTFDQIQEAIHMVRKGKFLPGELVDGIILPALRTYSDMCHPETADAARSTSGDPEHLDPYGPNNPPVGVR